MNECGILHCMAFLDVMRRITVGEFDCFRFGLSNIASLWAMLHMTRAGIPGE